MRHLRLVLLGVALSISLCALLFFSAGKTWQGYLGQEVLASAVSESTKPADDGGRILTQRIGGTQLVVLQYSGYDGPYVEDESNEEVSGVASILLHNAGEEMVESCRVSLKVAGQTQFFTAQMLPPGKTVIVLEENRLPYSEKEPSEYRGVAVGRKMEESLLDGLCIEAVDMGTISVRNLTDHVLTDVTLVYRTVIPGGAVYLGGIAYRSQIGTLAPGETVTVNPARYTKGYSEFVWAQ